MNNEATDVKKLVENWKNTTIELLQAIEEKKMSEYEELYKKGNQQFSLLKLIINSEKISELKPFEDIISEVIKDWRKIAKLLKSWSKDIFKDIKKVQKRKSIHKKFSSQKRQQGSIFSIIN